jgi:predicted MFS family arabinose efflux permease
MSFPATFNRLAFANLAAQCAEQLSLAAVPLVAVMTLGSGPGEIGFLSALQTLPFLLLSIPVGLLTDRVPRRALMVVAEIMRAGSLLVLLAMMYAGALSIPALAVLGFAGAVGTVTFSVAAPALVPALVPRESLGRANGRIELARSAAYTAGPPLAGALVAWVGGASVFVLAAVLSCGAVALLFRIAEPGRSPAATRHPLREMQDGARFVLDHEHLRPMLLTGLVWNLSWFVMQAAYVPYAIHVLGLSSQVVGATLGCYGAGMIAGSLLAHWFVSRMPFGRAIQLGPAVSVAAAGAMVLTLLVPTSTLAGLSFFLFGAGPVVWTITTSTLRQSVTPGGMLGRVGAVFLTVNAGARPVGAALGAAVGTIWGGQACLLLAFAGFSIQAIIILASRVNGLRRLPA